MSATTTLSDAARSLREHRARLLDRSDLVRADLRAELSDTYDSWLRELAALPAGVALAAVGGLGRREPAPYSDLDLVLLHDRAVRGLGALADSIWYPIWDAGVALDHAVRTPDQALAVAADDLRALLGMLDIRHVSGEAGLTGRVRAGVLEAWRASAKKRLPELAELARERWAIAGDAAFLLEPNLKESRGGLRDAQSLRALAAAQLVDVPVWVREAYPVLLDVRGELHRGAARADDVLHQQDQGDVAARLGFADRPAGVATEQARDQLLRKVNEAARAIGSCFDMAERRARTSTGANHRFRLFGAAHPTPARIGVAKDVVVQDGEVVLARDADPWADPGLVLRVARAAAERDLHIAPFTLERLAAESAPMPTPWPGAARADLLAVLGAGRPAIAVLESLDHAGLLVRLVPEWDAVRCRAQHNPVHRYTVDRHLLETAACVAEDDRGAERRDLLLVGALLHDIGKGFPGDDHSIVGAAHAGNIACRMGFAADDVDTIVALVRHHLLLPNTATRRDLDDPMTVGIVRDAIHGSTELLELLHALTVADAAATGPAAWSDWKAGLVADLVRRVHAATQGRPQPAGPQLDAPRRVLAERGELAVVIDHDDPAVTIAAPDAAGVLYRMVGVLALHALDIREASIGTHLGMAVNRFVVAPRFGHMPDPALVRNDLARAARGELALTEKLAKKERAYAPAGAPPARNRIPAIRWFDDSADATVVEFRGADEIGLLCRITAALERARLDVRTARVSSVAGVALGAFYVTGPDGRPVAAGDRPGLERLLRAAW